MRWTLLASLVAACVPTAEPPPPNTTVTDEWDERLAEREVDYSAALRIAALRLTGVPTLVEIERVANAGDLAAQKVAYEELVRSYMSGRKFTRQMVKLARDTLRMGEDPQNPLLDTAPNFMAQVIVENRSYLELLTATTGTCPTFDNQASTFTAANCANNSPQTVGLLTHPGMHRHFFGNLAFRRVRWVQETFACAAFPAEMAATQTDVGGASPYTGTFPFSSIAGAASGGRVDFLDTSSVICANCHSNMNHIAPLFASYDQTGRYQTTFAVPVPLPNEPRVELRDYLPPGEGLAWRFGVPVTDMASLGQAMAKDPAIAECAVARVWNWAMGKNDIVDNAARVPRTTIDAEVTAFVTGGYKLRDAMYRVFTSDDFVRF